MYQCSTSTIIIVIDHYIGYSPFVAYVAYIYRGIVEGANRFAVVTVVIMFLILLVVYRSLLMPCYGRCTYFSYCHGYETVRTLVRAYSSVVLLWKNGRTWHMRSGSVQLD